MGRFFSAAVLSGATILASIGFCAFPSVAAGEAASPEKPGAQSKSGERMSCGARIECVTPDGHAGQVSRLHEGDPGATALIMEDDTVTCLLQEGETNFVIELPPTASLDRFTFVNENAVAQGELKISVSNQRLAVTSPDWTQVEGIVPFAHKRLFGVCLLGIEARYVRLSFHVEKQGRIAALASFEKSGDAVGTAERSSRFQTSEFERALDSKFATLHSRGDGPVLLSAISSSVAPLPADE